MKSKMLHTNINVTDLEKSIAFYREALGLTEEKRSAAGDGSFTIVVLTDGSEGCRLELTWLRDHGERYDLGENEWHIAFRPEDPAAARAKHEEMGCICYDNTAMGLYFIEDPDGYWLEIVK